jgi:diguanylate cyclase
MVILARHLDCFGTGRSNMATTLVRNTAPREHPGRYYAYLSAVAACAIVACAVTVPAAAGSAAGVFDVPFALWLTAGLALVAEFRPVDWRGLGMSPAAMISLAYIFATMAAWGYLPALVAQTGALIILGLQLRASLWRQAFNIAQMALALTAAWWVWTAFSGGALWSATAPQLVGLLLAGAAWTFTSISLVSLFMVMRTGGRWHEHAWTWLKGESALRTTIFATAPLLATAAVTSGWLVLASAIPLFTIYRILRTAAERERLADLDPLTGLLNRKGFQQAAERKLIDAAETQTRAAVVVLDLDRFADVNSALGHDVGDQLLLELAHRFRSERAPGKAIARLGGDEFAFAWGEIDGMTDPLECAREIRARLDKPIQLGEISVEVDGSMGIAVFPDDGEDYETLLRHADIAMSETKKRNAVFTLYAPEFDHSSPERLILLGDLRRALDHPDAPGVELFYQPQVCLATGRVFGAEALLRYTHPQWGQIKPAELIDAAEQSSVMRTLTERVVDIALRQLREWTESGHDLKMAVNISVRDLQSPEFTDFLTGRLEAFGVPAERLRLEITESALMADPRRVVDNVQRLADAGVGISLDDFGTGFSSMQHLRRLPVNEIKIDRMFVSNLIDDPDNAAIVSSTIDLGRALDLMVVAEGVEDEKTRKQLEMWGCHAAQGWHYAKPMDAARFDAWLRRHEAARVLSSTTGRDPDSAK